MAGSKGSSEAKVAANRRNAQKSTGPRTAEGKAKVRANAVKHGLAGAGIALPGEDAAAVEERFLQLQEEMGPTTLEGALLIRQAALMSVRIDRAARHEGAALAMAGRHAASEFDLAHAAETDRLFQTIEISPGENYRRLRARLDGVDRLIIALEAVRDHLESSVWRGWNEQSRQKIDAFFGGDYGSFPVSRADALLNALRGDFRYIPVAELANIPRKAARIEWARQTLRTLVDAEIARLVAHRAQLDPAPHQADRAGAAERALFDPNPAAILARKYEAAATRTFFRALRDFHALPTAEVDPAAEVDPTPASEISEADPTTPAEIQSLPDVAADPVPASLLVDPDLTPVNPGTAGAEADGSDKANSNCSDKANRAARVPDRAGANFPDKANPDRPGGSHPPRPLELGDRSGRAWPIEDIDRVDAASLAWGESRPPG